MIKRILLAVAMMLGAKGLFSARSIQEILKEEGLDPALAEGNAVTVYGSSLEDQALLLKNLDLPLKFDDFGVKMFFMEYDAVALWNKNKKSGCHIYIEDQYPQRMRDEEPLFGGDARPSRIRVLLHELRHCMRQNQRLPHGIARESDADLFAARTMAAAGYKHIPAALLEWRNYATGSGKDPDHDTTLFLDALVQGRPMPSFQRVASANREAIPVIKRHLEHLVAWHDNHCAVPQKGYVRICAYDVKKEMKRLSPLARRRVELFGQTLERKGRR